MWARSQHHCYIYHPLPRPRDGLYSQVYSVFITETRKLTNFYYFVWLCCVYLHFFLQIVYRPEHHQTAATMTETESLEKQQQHKSSNGHVLPEAEREDVFDHSYKEKEGPKPPSSIVWRNVVLMSLLHIGAAYGVLLIPSASPLTLLWCKYNPTCYRVYGCLFWAIFLLVFNWNYSCYVTRCCKLEGGCTDCVHAPPSIVHAGGL